VRLKLFELLLLSLALGQSLWLWWGRKNLLPRAEGSGPVTTALAGMELTSCKSLLTATDGEEPAGDYGKDRATTRWSRRGILNYDITI